MKNNEILHKELTEKILACAIETHKRLGPGFTEDVYEEGFAYELKLRGIRFTRQFEIDIPYRDIIIRKYRLDLVIEDKVVVELKAVSKLSEIHSSQIISYLKASGLEVGLLLNFNVRMMKDGIKRVVLSNKPEFTEP